MPKYKVGDRVKVTKPMPNEYAQEQKDRVGKLVRWDKKSGWWEVSFSNKQGDFYCFYSEELFPIPKTMPTKKEKKIKIEKCKKCKLPLEACECWKI